LRESSLARFYLVAYVLLVVYASLYPLSGWRDPGGSAFAFLVAPWPRYVTAFDVAANFFGYLPYGLLCVLAARPRLRPAAALLLAFVSAAALYARARSRAKLPAGAHPVEPGRHRQRRGRRLRRPDGCLAGAGTAWRRTAAGSCAPKRLAAGTAADLGLTLLGLWLFAQLNPATLLFGTGDLRDLFSGAVGERHAAEVFVSIEALTTAANLTAVALLASAGVREGAPVRRLVAALIAVALTVKTLAFAILMQAEHGSPGSRPARCWACWRARR